MGSREEIQKLKRALQLKEYELENFLQYARQIIKILDEERIFKAFLSVVMGQVGSPKAVMRIKTVGDVFVLWKGISLPDEARRKLEIETRGMKEILNKFGLNVIIDLSFASEETALYLKKKGVEHLLSLRENFLALHLPEGSLREESLNYIKALFQITLLAYENILFHREIIRRQRLERELEIARAIQTGLLPEELKMEGYEAFALSNPSHEVGGDYYDYFPRGDKYLAVIGDVAGKGIPAALIMATLQASLRTLVKFSQGSPAELITMLNKTLLEQEQDKGPVFVTLFALELNRNGDFTYTNAGHNPPMIVKRNGKIEELSQGGLVLGVADVSYEEGSGKLGSGDMIFMYTDGLSEARFLNGDELGKEGLREIILPLKDLPPYQIGERIIKTVSRNYEVFDDLTFFIIKKN